MLPSMEKRIEKRRYERVKVSVNINWGMTRDCVNDGRVTSISLGGCFVQTSYKLLSDQIVFVRLFFKTELILLSRIRYVLLDIGAGVEFIGMTEEEKLALQELIEYYKRETAAT